MRLEPIGAISQLNAKKPLSSFFLYNLLIYEDGLLFIQQNTGSTAQGILGAAFGVGVKAGQYPDRESMISDSKNHWYVKDQVSSINIKKGWFVDKINIKLKDGNNIKCGSKKGYKQRDNIIRFFPSFFSQTLIS